MGFPIRKSSDQRVFAPPRRLSQRITSFIACACQGIHQLPLRHLIVLIADAHQNQRFERIPAQKDQLLEISPGARLGLPIICGRLSVSPRQTDHQGSESEQIFSLRCHAEQAADRSRREPFLRMTDHPLNTRQWWSRTGSNRRHPACKAGALPAELRPLIPMERMVGLGGLEPPTSRLSSARSNQLSYKPSDRALASRRCLARPTGRRGSCRALAERQARGRCGA